jgi:DNA-binding NtrC family response regulator
MTLVDVLLVLIIAGLLLWLVNTYIPMVGSDFRRLRSGKLRSDIICAAIPEALMENELFGHERGSFTGADGRKEGCFEIADGGTLLLDEITEMKIELQPKLLRVIEDQHLRRIGGAKEIPLNVRVLASSNRNIDEAVRDGKLRADLYYRLSVFTIQVPPLRDRVEDLPVLAEKFLLRYAKENHKEVVGIDSDCLEAFRAYPWPGNVRQLRNIIERAVILCTGHGISMKHLPTEFRSAARRDREFLTFRLGTSLDEIERESIMRTLELARGNKTRAAAILGITPKTLYNKLARYGE